MPLARKTRLLVAEGITLAVILASMAIIFYGVFQVYYHPASLFRYDFASAGVVEEHFEGRIINVALLGLHNREEDNTFGDVYYVDTIMVAAIDFDRDSLTVVAVPRDSHVPIAGSESWDRLRQAYSYGYFGAGEGDAHRAGLDTAIATLDGLLGETELHYYVALNIEGLQQLVDSLGGVRYTVAEPLIGPTPRESLSAGPQLLDGRGYLTYLTYREPDARDDLNRVERQKDLLLATFDYFQDRGLFRYVLPVYAAYREHLQTNLSFNQVAALTLFAAERLEAEAIQTYSLQGEYFRPGNGDTYYLRLEEGYDRKLTELLYGRR